MTNEDTAGNARGNIKRLDQTDGSDCAFSLEELAVADLAKSGISVEVAERCGVELTDDASIDVHPSIKARTRGMVFPYYNADGTLMLGADGLAYARVKVFGQPAATWVKAPNSKSPKYVQGAKTGVCVYLPPVFDWLIPVCPSSSLREKRRP